jgi:hypothetical protein
MAGGVCHKPGGCNPPLGSYRKISVFASHVKPCCVYMRLSWFARQCRPGPNVRHAGLKTEIGKALFVFTY